MTILILELLSAISFVYAFFLLFVSFAPVHQIFILFIWQLFGALLYHWGSDKHKLWQASILLLFLPLLFFDGLMATCFILATAAYIFIYTRATLLRSNTEQSSKNFKRTLLVLIVAIFFRYWWPFMVASGSLADAAPYGIIHFLASVFFVRSIRHLESGMEPEKLKRANLRYLTSIIVISSLSILTGVKEFIYNLLQQSVYWVAYAFVYLAELVRRLFEALPKFIRKGFESEGPGSGPSAIEDLESVGEAVEEQLATWDTTILDMVVPIILTAVVIYILYRMIFKAGNRNFVGQDYVEVREYIRAPRPQKPQRRRDKFPAHSGDQIRFYYRRFLEKLTRNKVEVLKTDTSLDVNLKASNVFSADTNGIRDIYIRTRYGEKPADEATVAEMERLYKQLP